MSGMGRMPVGANWRRQDASVVGQKLAKGTLRRIVAFARPYRLHITLFLLLVVISAFLVIASPLLFKKIVDDGISKGNAGLVTALALVVALLAVVEAGLGLLQRWFSARIGEGLIYDLRTKVFGHVQQMPVAFFTRTQTGALVSRLNNDVIGAQQAFTSTLSGVVSNIISLILVVGAMLVLSWQLTLVAILMLPIFLIPARVLGRRLAAMTREQMNLNAEMSTTMTERFSVGGALLVTLFGRPAIESREFGERAGQVRDLGIRIAMLGRVFFTALTLVAALATALVYGVGGNLAVRNTLTIGTLLALVALLGRLYGPLTALSNIRVDVMTALVSFERVFEVLDLQPMIQDRPDASDVPADAASVEFDHVAFAYPTAEQVSLASLESVAVLDKRASAQVLEDVSFVVQPGQMVALVGPSGAGKTTITNLVARLYDVSGGAVRVGGHDVRDVTLRSLHDRIGYVTQDAHMFHDTIRANLVYAKPDATEEEMIEALQAAQVRELVEALPDGLDTVVGDRGHRLSGGERQRLAIARLLLKAPQIVVLDEATAHLDSESEVAVQQALDTALAGRTSLVIAHRLSTVRNADLILVVDHGNIVERGTHEQLLARGGEYADLYRTQFAESTLPLS
ncbi:ABC transporter ATP-binding protein [Kribbella sandramycini]|uniref:Fatty acid ABC transporter ATP-binding/permease protein n=1 Tax=Kribbella sandramycini TaxID=60450 RepID=A0A7Y4NZN6_9ACTN|nr:ABC transporter ATP-binding protein [Kribbella sandramycini]MBB6569099.1 ATP-binding cassette subfamily B protein [Kribbella sandramycini]NOL41058.1 ABC transporter ATP-binding protein [Kribbella sandramycini]